MEPCQSGLTYLFAKEAGCKSPREFESRRFRYDKNHYRIDSDFWYRIPVRDSKTTAVLAGQEHRRGGVANTLYFLELCEQKYLVICDRISPVPQF